MTMLLALDNGALVPVIPAPPNWLVVMYAGADDEQFWHDRVPLFGWVADGAWMVPITPAGIGRDLTSYFVLTPAGTGATVRAFDNEASYEDDKAALEAAEKLWRLRRRSAADTAAEGAP